MIENISFYTSFSTPFVLVVVGDVEVVVDLDL